MGKQEFDTCIRLKIATSMKCLFCFHLSCLLCLQSADLYAQDFFSINVNNYFGPQRSAGIQVLNASEVILTMSSDDARGRNSGGVLLSHDENNLRNALLLRGASGAEFFIKKVSRLRDGTHIVFYSTDDSDFPGVVVNGKLFVAGFSSSFSLLWHYQLDTQFNSFFSKFLTSDVTLSDDVVFSFFGGDGYYIGAIDRNGALIWSRKLGAFNVGEPTAIIFELAISDLRTDILFGYYQALTNESYLIRLDMDNGSILASRSFPDILISDVTFLVNGWAFSGTLDDKPLVALFDDAFNVVKVVGLNQDQIRGRIYLKSNPLHGQLVVMISNFRSTGILTLDEDLLILESSQFKDFSLGDFQVFLKSNKAFLAMTGNSLKQNDDDLVYVSMPLLKEDRMCPGGEWCVQTFDAEINIRSGIVVSQEFRLTVSTDRPVWRSLTGTSVAFCDDTPEKVGVEAFFDIRDTVCTGLPVEIRDLRNGGAVSVFWELEGQSDPIHQPLIRGHSDICFRENTFFGRPHLECVLRMCTKRN
jgi:hypothetical protein